MYTTRKQEASSTLKHGRISDDLLAHFVRVYPYAPSLALWRAIEMQALFQVTFNPPVLDLACGTGHVAEILLGTGIAAGCDLDAHAVTEAKRRKVYTTVAVADARALPYGDQTFRTVLSNCAIEHITGVEGVLSEVSRVLQPGGILVFTVPSESFNDWLFFPRLYAHLGLRTLAQKRIRNYNGVQKHHNMESLAVWQERLERNGMWVVEHHYYITNKTALVFSFWDDLAKKRVWIPGTGRQVSVLGYLFRLIPRRMLVGIWSHYLRSYYEMPSNDSRGSGLLVVARRKASES
jgi:ubiquinone/menaquinone biosynthesis C-methylase UbiE